MLDILTAPDSESGQPFIFDETIDYKAPRFRGQANPSDLSTRRWLDPILTPSELADYLRAAKGPEPAASRAKDQIARSYHRTVLKEAGNQTGDFAELVAVGMMGLAEAIDRFDPRRNNGFTAYALPTIRGRMQKESKAQKHHGLTGETRLQRAVYGNHDLTTEQASKVMGREVEEDEIEEARACVLAKCSDLEEYDTREPGYEDDDEEKKPGVVAVAKLNLAQRILDATLTKAHGSIEGLAADADRRAERLLKEIGRRAYALELVARDHARIAARAEPLQYLYRTETPLKDRVRAVFANPAPSNDSNARRYLDRELSSERHLLNGLKKRRRRDQPDLRKLRKAPAPTIRVWRCNEPAALAA